MSALHRRNLLASPTGLRLAPTEAALERFGRSESDNPDSTNSGQAINTSTQADAGEDASPTILALNL